MVHEKNNTHLKRTQNVKKDRNPILWSTFVKIYGQVLRIVAPLM